MRIVLYLSLFISFGCNTFDGISEPDPEACATYCESFGELCGGDDFSFQTCSESCQLMENDIGEANESTGNTVQCRLFHLRLLETSDPDFDSHCEHAGTVSSTCSEGGEF